MNSQYRMFQEKAPKILQQLKDFQEILKGKYDCSQLPIPHIHKVRHRKCCEDVADYFIKECEKIGLTSNKYLLFDLDRQARNRDGRITFADPKTLSLKDYPEINPWGLHFICESEGFAIEPLVKKPIKLESIAIELFGEPVPLHKIESEKTYTFWDIIETLDSRGVFPQ